MNKKRILFVGDTSTACNYGSIAVSETFLEMLLDVGLYDLEIIDYRSCIRATGVQGQELDSKVYVKKIVNSRVGTLKKLIKKVKESKPARFVKQRVLRRDFLYNYHIPVRYDLYEEFTQRVLNGEVLQYERRLIEKCDLVLINGEGSIVNGTDTNGVYNKNGLYVVYMSFLSKRLGKKCLLLNHTVDPRNRDAWEMIRNVYPLVDKVFVRERLSLDVLRRQNLVGGNIDFVPDILFAYEPKIDVKMPLLRRLNPDEPFLCLGDSSGIKSGLTAVSWDVRETYIRLVRQLQKEVCKQIVIVDGYRGENEDINYIVNKLNLPCVNLKNCNYHQLFALLKKSELFISGRWHASILSLLAKTPILLWGSDSHKTEALYELTDYPFAFFDVKSLPINIDRMVNEAKVIIDSDHARTWLLVDKYKKDAKQNINIIKRFLL